MLVGLIDSLKWIFDKIIMPIINAIEKAYRLIKGSKAAQQATVKPVPLPESPKQEKTAATNTKLLYDIKTNTAQNAASASDNSKAVSSGGPKVINITIGKFLDYINVTTNTLRESENEIEARIREMFGRVIIQGGYAQ